MPKSSQPWYKEGLRFTCTQCGRCCGGPPGYVWISPQEIPRLAESLSLSVAECMKQHIRRVGSDLSLLERPSGDCEFLARDGNGRTWCSIYEVRPMQCRTWPFWQSNLRSKRSWSVAARDCPGMNEGDHHPLPVIQNALARNADAGLRL